MTTVYGIKNCDTMQKAMKWLNEHRITYTFHNYKTDGLEEARLRRWLEQISLDVLVNRKGTTYRNLNALQKADLESVESAIPIMLQNTSLLKRPILEYGKKMITGFDPEKWASMIK